MHDKHPHDPLDFLYEELPPEAMEEARLHLAECEQCKRETAAIRDVVKIYRNAPAPALPSNFAETIAAKALEQAEAERNAEQQIALVAAAPAEADSVAADSDFDQMKRDVLAETPRGVRTWLFHPAWTVAASVLFICTVLIYISPRRDQIFYSGQSEAELMPQPTATDSTRMRRQPAEREMQERIPEPRLRVQKSLLPPAPAPSELREADAWDESAQDMQMETGVLTVPEPVPAAAAPAPMLDSASSLPAAPIAPPVPVAMPPVPASAPSASPALSAGGFGSAAGSLPAEPVETPAPQALNAIDQEAVMPSPASPPAPRQAIPSVEDAVPVGDLPREAKEDAGVIVEMPEGFTPPQLIERPTPIDTVKLARDLAFLAGMQIGNNEFDDAWITVGLLRKYDTEKADELTAVLIELEKAAETAAEPEQPADEPVTDKYSALAEPVETEAVPESATEVEPAIPVEEPQPVIELPAEPVQEEIPAEPIETALSISPMAAPTLPVDAPDVPKSSPEAFPPTLGESVQGNSVRVGPPKLFRSRSSGRGIFTTDPYWRRD